MSWVTLASRSARAARAPDAAVTVSVSKAGGRMVQRLFLTVRPAALPELTWWAYRIPVTVQIGEGDHAGRIRLTRAKVAGDDTHTVMAPTGRRLKQGHANAPMLQLPLPGLPEGGLKQRSVAWEMLGDALIVTLPWSGARGVAKPASPAADVPVPPPAAPVARAPTPPPPAAPVPPAAVAKPDAEPVRSAKLPVTMTYGEIERWAISNRLGSATHGFDLAAVNQARIRRGERPFAIRKGSGT